MADVEGRWKLDARKAITVLVQLDGACRANSFNYYKKTVGTDAQPVKLTNTLGTQFTAEGLPVGATVEFTVAWRERRGRGHGKRTGERGRGVSGMMDDGGRKH